jgi:hypothetical protein
MVQEDLWSIGKDPYQKKEDSSEYQPTNAFIGCYYRLPAAVLN